MGTLYIPTEEDIKGWVREAVNVALGKMKQPEQLPEEPLMRKQTAKMLNISR